ncbi:MAG: hypothetical protein GY711_02870 [bacterium]|nr:hypothetical protein [bacterium]
MKLLAAVHTALRAQNNDQATRILRALIETDARERACVVPPGLLPARRGKLDEAIEIHEKAAEYPLVRANASYNAACAYALKKHNEAALDWLERRVTALAGSGATRAIPTETV